jgi:hypothetical protein
MNRARLLPISAVAMGSAALLCGCGGGESGQSGTPPPPPAPPPQLTLDAANYQNALSFAFESANAGFGFAKLGADVADRLFDQPLLLTSVFQCPVSGSASIELTDRNRNGRLNANDELHLFLSSCNSDVNPLTGTIRIEIVTATDTPDGRAYLMRAQVDDLVISSMTGASPPVTIDFSGVIEFTRGASFDHYVLTFGDYDYARSTETRGATELLVDYLQRYDTLAFEYGIEGTVSGSAIHGQYRLATPSPLTGVVGGYPTAGRLTLNGGATSAVRLSEEGAAATDAGTVLVAVDANGDGTFEATVAQLPWSVVLPVQIFGSLRDQARPAALPLP